MMSADPLCLDYFWNVRKAEVVLYSTVPCLAVDTSTVTPDFPFMIETLGMEVATAAKKRKISINFGIICDTVFTFCLLNKPFLYCNRLSGFVICSSNRSNFL